MSSGDGLDSRGKPDFDRLRRTDRDPSVNDTTAPPERFFFSTTSRYQNASMCSTGKFGGATAAPPNSSGKEKQIASPPANDVLIK